MFDDDDGETEIIKPKKVAPTTFPTKKNNLFDDDDGADFPPKKASSKPQPAKKPSNNLFNDDDDAPLITTKTQPTKAAPAPTQKL